MLLFLSGAWSYPCSVSNSLKAYKLTINEPLTPIEEFNHKYLPHVVINICLFFFPLACYWFSMYRLSELGIEIRSVFTRRSQWSSQPSGSAQLSSRETFISKSEAKTISEINNLCEVIVLYMFTCLSLLWLPAAEFYGCHISCRSLFVLLLVQSWGLLWTIIHGVMQLAFSAIRKQMSIQNRLCAHVANIMI